MISHHDFLNIISDKSNRDSKIRGNVLGYIDDDFDPSKFPQVKPRVQIPGQPMSEKGYTCLGDYFPVPGDRVLLVPAGTSDYVILGSISGNTDGSEQRSLRAGENVLFIDNHGTTQNQGGGTGSFLQWTSSQFETRGEASDPYGMWDNGLGVQVIQAPSSGLYRLEGRVVFPATTGGAGNWRRVEILDYATGSFRRGGDMYVPNISHATIPTMLYFSTLPLYFNAGDAFRLRCSGSVGGGSLYPGGEQVSFLSVFYEGTG